MASVQPFLNLLLIGQRGHGKSSTGNSILGSKEFKESDATVSETLNCTVRKSMIDGTEIRVVDTPGFIDTLKPTEETRSQIGQAMNFCPEGFNAVIFVVRYGIRFTEEERQVFYSLKQYFGENILRDFSVIVMSHGDSFNLKYNNKLTFGDWLNKQRSTDGESPFVQLLNECNNRCVLFYNCGDTFEKSKSVKEMMALIHRDISKPYTSEYFHHTKTTRETLHRKLQEPEIQEKLSLLMDQIEIDMKNQEISYDAIAYKMNEFEKEFERFNDDSEKFQSFKDKFDEMREALNKIKKKENNKEEHILQRIFNEKCNVI